MMFKQLYRLQRYTFLHELPNVFNTFLHELSSYAYTFLHELSSYYVHAAVSRNDAYVDALLQYSLLAYLGEVFRQSQLIKMVQNYVKVGRFCKTMR